MIMEADFGDIGFWVKLVLWNILFFIVIAKGNFVICKVAEVSIWTIIVKIYLKDWSPISHY